MIGLFVLGLLFCFVLFEGFGEGEGFLLLLFFGFGFVCLLDMRTFISVLFFLSFYSFAFSPVFSVFERQSNR